MLTAAVLSLFQILKRNRFDLAFFLPLYFLVLTGICFDLWEGILTYRIS